MEEIRPLTHLEKRKIISSTGSYALDFYPSASLARMVFRRRPSDLEYQSAIANFFDLLFKEEVRLMLFNNLSAGLISPESQALSRSYIENLLPKSALRKMACVVGGDFIQRLLISNMHRGAESPYDMRFFESEEQAVAWLLQSEG
ncbi:hypothetical protein ACFSC6_10355 [Rufibacter sediminis]|uniref:STAS/SEC14 domain-containing protein n=1 Tax=Rufibacter sediminis TaxID=2762756 RepID=A0ABR6VP29_9BACT|nr:hypothetical protein [Rufibacter sediminis]MBC3538938.1 hypothetical protein [Rufibacter sediminis]